MDDTIALVVKISKHQYEICKQALKDGRSRPITECEFAIAVGTPLSELFGSTGNKESEEV